MGVHWVRLLSAVFLSLVSTSSFGVHTDYFFKDEAEARAASVWECGYVDAGLWNSLSGGAMPMETCMALAREKVVELGAAWSAQAPPGTRYCTPPPVRDDVCSKGPLTTAPDPVTGFPVGVYALKCYERQTLQCVETFFGGVGIAGGVQTHAGVIGIKGHPDPFKSADVYLLADVPPPLADGCTIDPIPEYTPDPEPVDITAPNFKLGTQLACMQNAIGASNGTSRVNSGYRSAPYNEHLQKVWDKWLEFLNAQRPECAAELATAENHKNAH
jgi:hypothetical protein